MDTDRMPPGSEEKELVSIIFSMSIHVPWICLLAYSSFLAVVFTMRFRIGSWLDISVVEN